MIIYFWGYVKIFLRNFERFGITKKRERRRSFSFFWRYTLKFLAETRHAVEAFIDDAVGDCVAEADIRV